MVNQQKIIPMGHMYGVSKDIEGVSALVNFEVIEIVDDNNPYSTLLGIDLAFDMDVVINLKKRRIKFEKKELLVIVLLDPTKGSRYTKPVHYYEEEDDLDQIYKITGCNEYWMNPTANGRIKWDRDSSCTSDLDEELKHWQNRLHEASMLRCSTMTKSVSCISTEVQNLPHHVSSSPEQP